MTNDTLKLCWNEFQRTGELSSDNIEDLLMLADVQRTNLNTFELTLTNLLEATEEVCSFCSTNKKLEIAELVATKLLENFKK